MYDKLQDEGRGIDYWHGNRRLVEHADKPAYYEGFVLL
jgi:hypothetical protein